MKDRFHQVETLRQLNERGWLGPLLSLNRSATGFLRTAFIGIGLHSGLLPALGPRPMTASELAKHLDISPAMTGQFDEWLDAGVQLGILGKRGGRYRIRSREVRGLLRPQMAPVAAFYEELVYVELPVLQRTPDLLRAGELFELSDANPEVVARASRLAEPYIASALLTAIEPEGPFRLLEVGCGTGAHIRAAARLNPELTAVGIDLAAEVAELARTNIAEAGLAERVEIIAGDIRDLEPAGDFDLVTLHQNIYYFDEDERVDLLRRLAGKLAVGGLLLITTLVRESGPASAALNLWGAMTKGASRLPLADELVADLSVAGYLDVQAHSLDGLGLYYAVSGRHGY